MSVNISIFPLLILVLLVVGAILFAIFGGKKSRRILASLGIILLVVIVSLFLFRLRPVRHTSYRVNTPSSTIIPAPVLDTPPIWTPGLETQFGAAPEPVNKLWISNFAEYLNQNPNAQILLARSQTSCTNQVQAEREALNDACRQLQNLLTETNRNHRWPGFNLQVTPADVRKYSFIRDRFVQSFQGAVGPIWRQALLIDTSPGKLQTLANRHARLHRAHRSTWTWNIVSIAGMMGIICLIYLFLNAATKGYYVWSLRLAAVVLLAVGVLIVLFWA